MQPYFQFFICFLFIAASSALQAQNYFSGKTPYVTQMHIHGWSNHNGATRPGSLQYHNVQSDSVGVDVLWWAEHHGLFKQDTLLIPFAGATVNPTTLDIINIPSNGNAEINRFDCIAKQGNSAAFFGGDTLFLSINSSSTQMDTLSYSPRSLSGLVKDIAFSKPMVSKPIFQFQIRPSTTDSSKTRIKIVFRLAWHYRQQQGQDIITYEFTPASEPAGIYTNYIDSVIVKMPLVNGWQQVGLDLWDAAAILDHGTDNTISDFELQLLASQGATLEAGVRDFSVVPLHYQTDSIIFGEKNILDDYSSTFHTHNILGVEFSGFQHMNAYIPKTENNRQIFEGKIYGNVVNWVNRVHLKGGLVSYNHMFGTNYNLDPDSVQDYRSDTTALFLLGNQAYGSDIIEVGYFNRGGGDLSRHLSTWDKLTANGLFLYGNGVSDSHGNEWMFQDYLFHTYIYAADSSDSSLLASLSLGKMYFGNYKLFQGEFYYTLDNLEMGDRGFLNNNNIQPSIHLTGAPAGSKIKLTQILLNATPSLPITYVYNETLIDTNNIPMLDMSQPSFIRFGVYDSLDNPLVFGQPIVVFGLQTDIQEPSVSNDPHVIIFPNPANDKLNIEMNFKNAEVFKIRILDMKGQQVGLVDEKFFYKGKYGYSVDINQLRSGSYIVEMVGEKKSYNHKFIVK